MDTLPKIQNTPLDGKQQAEALFGGIRQRRRDLIGEVLDEPKAIHGEHPPAIDLEPIREEWLLLWRIVLSDLTPIQLGSLRAALRELDDE